MVCIVCVVNLPWVEIVFDKWVFLSKNNLLHGSECDGSVTIQDL